MATESTFSDTSGPAHRVPADQKALNQIVLWGRLASAPVLRKLPSGEELCQFRLVVARPAGEPVRSDTIDCVAANMRVRRRVLRLEPQDELHIEGSLQRRFWRGSGGLASRYEVHVTVVRARRRRRNDASPGPRPASA